MFYHRAPKVTSKLAMLVLYQHAHFPLLSNLDVCLSRVLHHQASSCNQALILVLMLQFSYQKLLHLFGAMGYFACSQGHKPRSMHPHGQC